MLGVAEIETDGGGWNDVVHGSADSSTALKRRPLPSHLILLGIFVCMGKEIELSGFGEESLGIIPKCD